MKKRYHQTKKDRMHESHGMKRHMHHKKMDAEHESEGMHERMMHKGMRSHHSAYDFMGGEMYAGPKLRYMQEYDSSMMIHEDPHAIANLPQHTMMKPYPKCVYAHSYVPDTIEGIDHQEREDSKHQKHDMYPEKY